MIRTVLATLHDKGPMTCLQLVPFTGICAPELVKLLRKAVDAGALADRNGFYDLPADANQSRRIAYRWVEGKIIPEWVKAQAICVINCTGVLVLAELKGNKSLKGIPSFVVAIIDIHTGIFVCCNTSQNVTRSVLRYMPIDISK